MARPQVPAVWVTTKGSGALAASCSPAIPAALLFPGEGQEIASIGLPAPWPPKAAVIGSDRP